MAVAKNFVHPISPQQRQYQLYLKSWRWRFLRYARIWYDGGRCRLCNSAEYLEVHHRSYRHCGGNILLEFFDLTTVCHNDHTAFHKRSK